MLNALFGDPTRQLDKLHPKLHQGPDLQFRTQYRRLLENSVSTMKLRRNAAVEVLKTYLLSKGSPILGSKEEKDV